MYIIKYCVSHPHVHCILFTCIHLIMLHPNCWPHDKDTSHAAKLCQILYIAKQDQDFLSHCWKLYEIPFSFSFHQAFYFDEDIITKDKCEMSKLHWCGFGD